MVDETQKNRGGRPRKSPSGEAFSKRIGFRVTQEAFDRLKAKAAQSGQSVSDYTRDVVFRSLRF